MATLCQKSGTKAEPENPFVRNFHKSRKKSIKIKMELVSSSLTANLFSVCCSSGCVLPSSPPQPPQVSKSFPVCDQLRITDLSATQTSDLSCHLLEIKTRLKKEVTLCHPPSHTETTQRASFQICSC